MNPAVLYLVIFAVLGFMIWSTYSQQRRAKRAQEELQRMLKKGDDVITIGGIYGTIRDVDSEYVVLEIARGTRVRFVRRAIREIVSEDEYDDDVVDEYDEADEYDESDEVDGEYVDEGEEYDDDEGDEPEAPSAPTPPEESKS